MGSILGIFDANRKSESLKTIMDNLNFTLDTMSREIRFGKNYHCENTGTLTDPRSCPAGDSFVSFLSAENKQVVYRLTGTRIEKSIDGGTTYIEVTAPEVTITGLKLITLGAEAYPGDTAQPRVFMQVSGYAGSKLSSRTNFSIQTIVTQRYPDGPALAGGSPPPPPPPPTPTPVVNITANPSSGTVNIVNPQLSWGATESPTSCTASGDWSGSQPVTGTNVSQGVLNTVKTYTYTLTCSNANGAGAPASAQVVVSEAGPIGNWKQDELSGAFVADSSGNGYNGTVVGGAPRVSGKVGNAVSFVSGSDYISVGDIPTPTDFSFSAWIYPTATSNASDYIILNKTGTEYDFRLGAGSGVFCGSSASVGICDTADLTSAAYRNQWHHIAYTFSNSGNIHKLYRNGVQVASGTNNGTIPDGGNSVWIGRNSQFNFGSFLGIIDEVKLYNRVLTPSEISALP